MARAETPGLTRAGRNNSIGHAAGPLRAAPAAAAPVRLVRAVSVCGPAGAL